MSSDDRERDAFLIGEQDFYDGVPIGDCPYPMPITEPENDLAVHWCRGWRRGEARAARLTLELQLSQVNDHNAPERAPVAWVIDTHSEAEAEQELRHERPTLH